MSDNACFMLEGKRYFFHDNSVDFYFSNTREPVLYLCPVLAPIEKALFTMVKNIFIFFKNFKLFWFLYSIFQLFSYACRYFFEILFKCLLSDIYHSFNDSIKSEVPN